MKCLFLYNPVSGRGKIARKLGYIEKTLHKKFEQVDVYATSSAEDMTARAHDGAGKYDLILFSGGDGTFNNVLQGIGETDVCLGYLPAGTANDVAHSLSIPRSVRGALKVVLGGHEERIDCMRVNGERYAMYVAAAGTITSLTYETPQDEKKKLGWLAYVIHGLKKNMKFEVYPFSCTCGGQTVHTHGVLAFVMNGRSIAGFPVNKEASMKDGMLEVAIIRQAEKPNFFRKIGAYLSLATFMIVGVKVRKKDILIMRGERVSISTAQELVWDFDGEEGIRGNAEIEVLPRRVRMIVPKNKKV